MSTTSDVFDAIVSVIETALTSAVRLSNSYKTSDNPDHYLRNGFGVQLGPAVTNRMSTYSVGFKRTFSFVLTRQVYATDNDQSTRQEAEKQILEDQLSVLKAFEADRTLGGKTLAIDYESDGGVEFVNADSKQFIELKTNVTVVYVESVT